MDRSLQGYRNERKHTLKHCYETPKNLEEKQTKQEPGAGTEPPARLAPRERGVRNGRRGA